MIKILSVLTFSLLSFFSYSQSLTNENFESWIDNTAFIDPEGWVTLNDYNAEFGLPTTVFKTTDAKEGQYAAHMQTFTFVDGNNVTDTLPSILVYGSEVNSGVSYTWPKRLKTISFYYKYKPIGIDTGVMYLKVGYRDKKTNKYIDQGGTYFIFSKKEVNYTKVTLPLYYNSNFKCDTFVLAFVNSVENMNGNRRKPGTILIIDDIDTEWENFPAVAIQKIPDTDFGVYPNPANEILHVKGLLPGFYKVKVVDALGKTLLTESLTNENLNIEKLNSGMYRLIIESVDRNFSSATYFFKK